MMAFQTFYLLSVIRALKRRLGYDARPQGRMSRRPLRTRALAEPAL